MKVRILLVDDHELFLDALRTVLSLEPDMEVVGQVSDGMAVVPAAISSQPDVVCMDVNMPGANGVDATKALRQHMPAIKIVGLSGHDDSYVMAQMAAAGAVGYILKGRAGEELVQTIRNVMRIA